MAKLSYEVSERFGEGVLAWGYLVQRFSASGEERKGMASKPPGQLPSARLQPDLILLSYQECMRKEAFRAAGLCSEQGFRAAEVWMF